MSRVQLPRRLDVEGPPPKRMRAHRTIVIARETWARREYGPHPRRSAGAGLRVFYCDTHLAAWDKAARDRLRGDA